MFRIRCVRGAAALGLVLSVLPASAANVDDEVEPLGVSIRVAGRALFNAKGSVLDVAVPTGPAAGDFDDGYVRPDASGSTTDTWHWGYQNASQVVGGGTQLEFHRLDNSPRPGNFDLGGGNPLLGGEIVIGFEAFRFDWGRKEAKFGVELGYGYLPYSASGSARVMATSTYTSTTYNLAGITPPPPGYAGPFAGPGPLVPLTPAGPATTVTDVGTGAVDTGLDVSLHSLRFGAWIEYPLTEKITLTGAFGYSTMYADGELSVTESLTFANPAMPSVPAVTTLASDAAWLQGAYLELRGNWRLTRTISAFVGGEIRTQNDFRLQAGNRLGQLEFGFGFAATLGVQFDF